MLRLVRPPLGQFWVIGDGREGQDGGPGNGESATCRFYRCLKGLNPSLCATVSSKGYKSKGARLWEQLAANSLAERFADSIR
jgi:hypothetical protein